MLYDISMKSDWKTTLSHQDLLDVQIRDSRVYKNSYPWGYSWDNCRLFPMTKVVGPQIPAKPYQGVQRFDSISTPYMLNHSLFSLLLISLPFQFLWPRPGALINPELFLAVSRQPPQFLRMYGYQSRDVREYDQLFEYPSQREEKPGRTLKGC